MVFENLVSSLLNKYLGDYVENLDASQLKIGVFSGNVQLNNLKLKKAALDQFGLPFKVIEGVIGKLHLKIPWKSLQSNKTEVLLENLYIRAATSSDFNPTANMETVFQTRMAQIITLEANSKLKKKSESVDSSENTGRVHKYATLIIRNLIVTVRNINILFEQKVTHNQLNPYYYVLNLSSFTAKTTDENYQDYFSTEDTPIIYKFLKLDDFSAYWCKGIWDHKFDYMDDMRKYVSEGDIVYRTSNLGLKMQINTNPEKKLSVPRFSFFVDLEKIKVNVNTDMVASIISTTNYLKNMKIKAMYHQYFDETIANISIRRWKYALNLILNEFIIPRNRNFSPKGLLTYLKKLHRYRELYEQSLAQTNEKNSSELFELVNDLSLHTLLVNRHLVRSKLKRNKIAMENKAKQQGWFSKIFGKSNSEIPEITDINIEETTLELQRLITSVDMNLDSSTLPNDFKNIYLCMSMEEFEIDFTNGRYEFLSLHLSKFSLDLSMFAYHSDCMRACMTVFDMNILAMRENGFKFVIFETVKSLEDNRNSPLCNLLYFNKPYHKVNVDRQIHFVVKKTMINLDMMFIKELVCLFYNLPKLAVLESIGEATKNYRLYADFTKAEDIMKIIRATDEVWDVGIDFCVSLIVLGIDFSDPRNKKLLLNLGYFNFLSKESEEIKNNNVLSNSDEFAMRSTMQIFSASFSNISCEVIGSIINEERVLEIDGCKYVINPISLFLEMGKSNMISDYNIYEFIFLVLCNKVNICVDPDILLFVSDLLTFATNIFPQSQGQEDPIFEYVAPRLINTLKEIQVIDKNDMEQLDRLSLTSEASVGILSTDSPKRVVKNKNKISFVMFAPELSISLDLKSKFASLNMLKFYTLESQLSFKLHSYDRVLQLLTKKILFDQSFLEKKIRVFDTELSSISFKTCLFPNLISSNTHYSKWLESPSGVVAKDIFINVYDSTEHSFNVILGDLHFNAEYKSIKYLKAGFEHLMESFTYKNKTIGSGNEEKEISRTTKEFLSSCDKIVTFSFNIRSVILEITYDFVKFSKIQFREMDSKVEYFMNQDVCVSVKLDVLDVVDESLSQSKYKNVVSVPNGKLFSMKFYFYKDNYENEIAPFAGIDLTISQLKFVFLYRFMMDMLKWTRCLIDPTSALILAEDTMQGISTIAENHVKSRSLLLAMLVKIGAPIIIIPFNSMSNSCCVVDLGRIIISNEFIYDESGIVVLKDKMMLRLTNMNLSRALNNSKSFHSIIEPIDIQCDIYRHLDTLINQYSINLSIPSISLRASSQDVIALSFVMVENMQETSILYVDRGTLSVVKRTDDQSIITKKDTEKTTENESLIIFCINIDLYDLSVLLYNVKDIDQVYNYRDNVYELDSNSKLSQLFLKNFKINLTNTALGELTIRLELQDISLIDCRVGISEITQKVIYFDNVSKKEDKNINLTYRVGLENCKNVYGDMCDLTMFFNMEYLLLLYTRVLTPLMTVMSKVYGNDNIPNTSTKSTLDIFTCEETFTLNEKQNKIGCTFNFGSTRIIAYGSEEYENAIFMKLDSVMSITINDSYKDFVIFVKCLEVDCAQFNGNWFSEDKCSQVIMCEDLNIDFGFDHIGLSKGGMIVRSIFGNLSPPTLRTLFQIREIFTSSTSSVSDNQSQDDNIDEPFWGFHKTDESCWYLKPFLANDFPVGTFVWIRVRDSPYRKMIVETKTEGKIYCSGDKSLKHILVSLEDYLRAVPDVSLINPSSVDQLKTSMLVLVNITSCKGINVKELELGEIINIDYNGDMILVNIYLFRQKMYCVLTFYSIFIVPKDLYAYKPSIGSLYLVRLPTGLYRMGTVISYDKRSYKFDVGDSIITLSRTDTSGFVSPWRRIQEEDNFEWKYLYTTVLHRYFNESGDISAAPVVITAFEENSFVTVINFITDEIEKVNLGNCLYLPPQRGRYISFGSRWLIKESPHSNIFLGYTMCSKRDENLEFMRHDVKKLAKVEDRPNFIIDRIPLESQIQKGDRVLYFDPNKSTYFVSTVLKKIKLLDKLTYTIRISKSSELITCSLHQLRDRVLKLLTDEVVIKTKKTFRLACPSVNLILEGEFNGKLLPLLHMSTSLNAALYNWDNKNICFNSRVTLESSYYNNENGQWEPFIEKPVNEAGIFNPWSVSLHFSMIKCLKNDVSLMADSSSSSSELLLDNSWDTIETYLVEPCLKIKAEEKLLLTISEKTLEAFTKVVSTFSSESSKVVDSKFLRGEYTIKNMLSVPIVVRPGIKFRNSSADFLVEESISLYPVNVYTVTDVMSTDDNYYISMKISGFKTLHNLSLISCCRTSIKLEFEHETSIRNIAPMVVLEIEPNLEGKRVIIRPMIKIDNHTSKEISFALVNNQITSDYTVSPDTSLYPSFCSVSEKTIFRLYDDEKHSSVDVHLKDLLKLQSVTKFYQLKSSYSIGLSLVVDSSIKKLNLSSVLSDTLDRPLVLTFESPVVFNIHIPHMTSLSFSKTFDYAFIGKKTIHLYWLNEFKMSKFMYIRIDDYFSKKWVCETKINSLQPGKSHELQFSSKNSKEKLTLYLERMTSDTYKYNLYAALTIENKCYIPLTIKLTHMLESHLYIIQCSKVQYIKSYKSTSMASVELTGVSNWSKGSSVSVIGDNAEVICKKDSKIYKLNMRVEIGSFYLSKNIIIEPFYKIKNCLSEDITVIHGGSISEFIPAGGKIHFWPTDKFPMKLLLICNGQQFPDFYPNTDENIIFKSLHICEMITGVVITTKLSNKNMTLTFMPYTAGVAPCLVVNVCKKTTVVFKQKDVNVSYPVPPNYKFLYLWDDYDGILHAQGSTLDNLSSSLIDVNILMDSFVEIKNNDGTSIYVVTFLDGIQRTCLYTDELHVAKRALNRTDLNSSVNFSLDFAYIGLSLVNLRLQAEVCNITINSNEPYWEKSTQCDFKLFCEKSSRNLEKCYNYYRSVYVKGDVKSDPVMEKTLSYLGNGSFGINNNRTIHFTDMVMCDKNNQRFDIRRNFYPGLSLCLVINEKCDVKMLHFVLFHIQLDNPTIFSAHSIVLSPKPVERTIDSEACMQKPFVEAYIVVKHPVIYHKKTIIHVNKCEVLVQPLDLNLDLGFISNLTEFITSYSMATELDKALLMTNLNENNDNVTKSEESADKSQIYFIFDYLHLSPLKITLAFSTTSSGAHRKDDDVFIKSLLSHLPLVDSGDVQLLLSCFEITSRNKFVSSGVLVKRVVDHYTFQSLRQCYVLIFGLDVIGNPYNFVNEFANGAKNFFYEPYLGVLQGGTDAFKGLGFGIRSLASGTVGNTAGVISKVTKTIGSGLAVLSLDDEHRASRRENIKNAPTNIQEGFVQGGKGLAQGIVSGISGIVVKPFEGIKSEGAAGFFKGFGKGLAGVITKPIGGVVDLASGVFQGVKSEIKGGKTVKIKRISRAFYADRILRTYIHSDSVGYRVFQKTMNKTHKCYGQYVTYSFNNINHYILTDWFMLFINCDDVLDNFNIKTSINLTTIQTAVTCDSSIKIVRMMENSQGVFEIKFSTQSETKKFYKAMLNYIVIK